MKICNLADGLGQLAHAMAELNQSWAETQAHWNDQTSKEFEETHLRLIQPQMQGLTAAGQLLAGTVDKAARDLEDPREQA
jgi:uncharacterized protein YukE